MKRLVSFVIHLWKGRSFYSQSTAFAKLPQITANLPLPRNLQTDDCCIDTLVFSYIWAISGELFIHHAHYHTYNTYQQHSIPMLNIFLHAEFAIHTSRCFNRPHIGNFSVVWVSVLAVSVSTFCSHESVANLHLQWSYQFSPFRTESSSAIFISRLPLHRQKTYDYFTAWKHNHTEDMINAV